eukprot:scaffold2713_cov166-Alexandrium_tamarense.AAC.11
MAIKFGWCTSFVGLLLDGCVWIFGEAGCDFRVRTRLQVSGFYRRNMGRWSVRYLPKHNVIARLDTKLQYRRPTATS